MSEERADIATRFKKGNKFWEARSKHGRRLIWEDPQEMLEACVEYFEWVESNPLWESKPMIVQGEVYDAPIPKMRAMTLDGLSTFLGIARKSWDNYSDRPDFLPVVEFVESVIRDQKFSGAAAGLLNANIIARDLKLRDTIDANVGGQEGNPLNIKLAAREMTPEEAIAQYNEFMQGK